MAIYKYYYDDCFYIEALSSWDLVIDGTATPTLQISNNRETWTQYTLWTQINLAAWGKLYIKNTSTHLNTWTSNYCYFSFSWAFAIWWNLRSLNNWYLAPVEAYTFYKLFYNCTGLKKVKLDFEINQPTAHCFESMFEGCTKLEEFDVKWSLTSTADSCCKTMFKWCSSLISVTDLPNVTMSDYCYRQMFENCVNLQKAPKIGTGTVGMASCQGMFMGCTSLICPPELPATILSNWLEYYGMFQNCTSLVTAPDLPATTVWSNTYQYMFSWCTSLENIPSILPATTVSYNTYDSMFYGCSSITTAPKLPATTLGLDCYHHMFYGCTNLRTVPNLPATTLQQNCYTGMFRACPNLEEIPQLPATVLTDSCYQLMFGRWYNNEHWTPASATQTGDFQTPYRVPMDWTWTTANYALQYMFDNNFTPTIDTTFYIKAKKKPVEDNLLYFEALSDGSSFRLWEEWSNLYSNNFEYSFDWINWSNYQRSWGAPNQTINVNAWDRIYFRNRNSSASSHLNKSWYQYYYFVLTWWYWKCHWDITYLKKQTWWIDTLLDFDFCNLFFNCTNLITAPDLPSTNLALYCYGSMFAWCTNLTVAPKLPATTLAQMCYILMFSRCSSLIKPPELPATTIPASAYSQMFIDCTSLVNPPNIHATSISGTRSCMWMFRWCTSLKYSPDLSWFTTLWVECFQDMFRWCINLETLSRLYATTLPDCCYQHMFKGCSKIKLSSNTSEYPNMYSIPYYRSITSIGTDSVDWMFDNTWWSFTWTPSVNTSSANAYYSTDNILVW